MEPLPEIGRINASGTICGGIFKNWHAGLTKSANKSSAPEAFSIVIEVTSAIKVGNSEIVERNPSSAPERNASKTGVFLLSA